MRDLYVGNDPAFCLAESEEQFFRSPVSSVVQRLPRRGVKSSHRRPENLSVLGNAVAADSGSLADSSLGVDPANGRGSSGDL